jgi:hypothetical protein
VRLRHELLRHLVLQVALRSPRSLLQQRLQRLRQRHRLRLRRRRPELRGS